MRGVAAMNIGMSPKCAPERRPAGNDDLPSPSTPPPASSSSLCHGGADLREKKLENSPRNWSSCNQIPIHLLVKNTTAPAPLPKCRAGRG